jgi:hypothetical protein
MGNYISFVPPENHNHSDTCLICWDEVHNMDRVICVRCNIKLHAYCEEIYRNNKGYCKCPHCQRIGTLGCDQKITI